MPFTKGHTTNVGKPHSDERRDAISASMEGRTFSAAHRAALSAAKRGRAHPHTTEWNKKIGEAQQGKHVSDETRAKQSAAIRPKPSVEASRKRAATLRATLQAKLPPIEVRRRERKICVFMRACLHRLGVHHTGSRKRQVARLGYTSDELRAHLEALFLDGMTWENYGAVWSIDHIRPVIDFVRRDELNPAVVNALTNLQPLWTSDNSRKHAKVAA